MSVIRFYFVGGMLVSRSVHRKKKTAPKNKSTHIQHYSFTNALFDFAGFSLVSQRGVSTHVALCNCWGHGSTSSWASSCGFKHAKLMKFAHLLGNVPYKHHILCIFLLHLHRTRPSLGLLGTWAMLLMQLQTIRKAWNFSAEFEKSLRHQAWSLDYLSANMDVSQEIWPLAKYVDLNKKILVDLFFIHFGVGFPTHIQIQWCLFLVTWSILNVVQLMEGILHR